MGISPFFTMERLTGAVLIASFISFAIGGTLPILGDKGNMRIFNLPVSEHLQAIAANALVWRWANVWMGAAAVILLALAAYGASLLQVGLVPAWAAWATILFSLALLVQLLVMGDTLSAFHYLPPVLIGVLLVLRG